MGPVIASEAKQSISPRKERMDCFVATLLAMTAPHPSIFRNSAFATFSSVERGMSSTK
jgi:hypothetical protein